MDDPMITAWSKNIIDRTATTTAQKAITSHSARIGFSRANKWNTKL